MLPDGRRFRIASRLPALLRAPTIHRSASLLPLCARNVGFLTESALLGPWVRRFLLDHLITERNPARNTQRGYRDSLRLLLPFVAEQASKPVDQLLVVDISAERVRGFLQELEETRGCGVFTRNQLLAAIHALARFVGLHSLEHVHWFGQLHAIPSKRAPRTAVTYPWEGQ